MKKVNGGNFGILGQLQGPSEATIQAGIALGNKYPDYLNMVRKFQNDISSIVGGTPTIEYLANAPRRVSDAIIEESQENDNILLQSGIEIGIEFGDTDVQISVGGEIDREELKERLLAGLAEADAGRLIFLDEMPSRKQER